MNATNFTYTVQELWDKELIIFSAISGSNAYGTNTPESDKDIRGVFVQPLKDALTYGYIKQVSDEKNDVTYYELGYFMHLLAQNNPNILELLAMPKDCIIYRDQMFTECFEKNVKRFLTKRTKLTFASYATEQINKAQGYNKKINWEESKITRKGILDFCYVLSYYSENGTIKFNQNDSILLKTWLDLNNLTQNEIGLSAINHMRDMYAMWKGNTNVFNGIISNEETSNDIQLQSIPKDSWFLGYLYFNKDAYSIHCKEFKQYQIWLKERNENRFKMNKEHGKNYDSKNMMHTYRLLMMANELMKGELRVRRNPEEVEKLMKIRRGEYEYDDLVKEANEMIVSLEEGYKNSTLPDAVDMEFIYSLLFSIRKFYYALTFL